MLEASIPTMQSNPLVSIVMSVFNTDKYIHRAIESILNQTLSNFEFIIVNDASKDKTSEILRSFTKKDKRIRVINNRRNLRVADSLNIGVAAAKADFIARMDADDISHHPQRLELQYIYLKKHPKVAIVGGNIAIIDENEREVWKREYPTKSKDLKKVMFRYSPFAHPTVMFRKKIFEEFGGYNSKMIPCEDIDFWFRIGAKYEFGNISRTLLKYTLSSTSSSRYNLRDTELLGFRIKMNAIKNHGYRPSMYDVVYNLLEFLSLWIIPASFRIKLYNILRSNKLI